MELRIREVDKGCGGGGGSDGDEGRLAKRRALFPEGRGLGVGVKERKRESKIGCSLREADEARVDGLD